MTEKLAKNKDCLAAQCLGGNQNLDKITRLDVVEMKLCFIAKQSCSIALKSSVLISSVHPLRRQFNVKRSEHSRKQRKRDHLRSIFGDNFRGIICGATLIGEKFILD